MPRPTAPRRNRVYDPTELYESGDRIFRLVERNGGVTLTLVNAGGASRLSGNLLAIDAGGVLHRYGGVNRRAGLCLDQAGRIQTAAERYQRAR